MDQQARAEKLLEQSAREGDGAEWRRLLREAAALGHRGAAGIVRVLCDEDEEGGAAVLQEEQRKGCVWSTLWLGRCYENGWGVKKDHERAVALFKEAAEAGNVVAKYNLGHCYKNGRGVIKNLDTAADIFVDAGAETRLSSLPAAIVSAAALRWQTAPPPSHTPLEPSRPRQQT